jgi:hypothetical protein
LFERPRIGAPHQHLEIVIRLEDQRIEIAKSRPDFPAGPTEIRRQADAESVSIADNDSYGLASVVGNAERLDVEASDLEGPSRTDNDRIRSELRQTQTLESALGRVDRNAKAARESRSSAYVVTVFMGDHHGYDRTGIDPDPTHAAFELPAGKSCIYEQTIPIRLHQNRIPRAAGTENTEPHRRRREVETQLTHERMISASAARSRRAVALLRDRSTNGFATPPANASERVSEEPQSLPSGRHLAASSQDALTRP